MGDRPTLSVDSGGSEAPPAPSDQGVAPIATTTSDRNPTSKEDASKADTGTTSTQIHDESHPSSETPAPKRSMEEIKAAARAYALSSTTSSKKRVPSWQKGLLKHPQLPPQPQQLQVKGKASKPLSQVSTATTKNTWQPHQQVYPPPGRYTYHPYQHALPPGYHHPHHLYYHHPPPPPGASPSTTKSSTTKQAVHPPPPPAHIYSYPYPPYHAAPPPPPSYSQLPSTSTVPRPTKLKAPPQSDPVAQAENAPQQAPAASTIIPPVAASQNTDATTLAADTSTTTEDQISWTAERLLQDEDLDDYERLVKGLNLLEVDVLQLFQDDDEDEYNVLEDDVGDDDEDDDDNDNDEIMESRQENGTDPNESETAVVASCKTIETDPHASPIDGSHETHVMDDALYRELSEELGWLEEEDIEAAVASLLDYNNSNNNNIRDDATGIEQSPNGEGRGSTGDQNGQGNVKGTASSAGYASRARGGGATSVPFQQKSVVSAEQYKQISLLLQKHYQLLVQQAVLTVRAAHYHKYHRSRTDRTDFLAGGETADDLVEILDAAVGMLHDLRQNRKDAIRYSLQFNSWNIKRQCSSDQRPQRAEQGETLSLNARLPGSQPVTDIACPSREAPASEMRLTRSQFHRTLIEQSKAEQVANTVFDIRGLLKLDDTFSLIDKSVQHDDNNDQAQLLEIESNKEACEYVLNATQQTFDPTLIPESRDVSENFCNPQEFFGPSFKPPCSENQQTVCRRNRNLFTAGEDNLVLRGVNLYGEKQWMLIADRFLPERSSNIISQRYSKLCVLLYKANGIAIDADGRLEKPPKLESIDDIDETAMKKLKPAQAPAILNVHRWSLEEDLTLLKAVPITGHMWAELGARLIPHRDRGHLRKRYQVLERRVRSTVERSNKRDVIKTLEDEAVRPPKVPDNNKSHSSQSRRIETRPASQEVRSVPVATTAGVPATEQTSQAAKKGKENDSTTEAKPAAPQSTSSIAPSVSAPLHSPHGYSPHPSSHPYSYPYPMYGSPPPAYHHYGYPHYPYTPYMHPPHPHYYEPYFTEDGSRAAFEKLAHEGSVDDPAGASGWSQISQQMQDLMKDENMVASAMAVDLARSPSKPEVEKTKQEETSRKSAKESAGLLAGVLEHAKKAEDSRASDQKTKYPKKEDKKQGHVAVKDEDEEEKATYNMAVAQSEPACGHYALSKEHGKTPARDPSKVAIFSTDGTQIGLSPAFQQSPAQSLWAKIPAMPSPALGNLSVASFPATSQMVGFSPSPHPSPQNEMTPPAHSLDTVALQHLAQSGQSVSSKRKVLFDHPLSEDDVEAISGLNLMASSPGLPSPAVSVLSTNKQKDPGTTEGRSSLFAQVVGEQEKDRKKRKLVF
ncbi:hypothetical protein ACA910_012907 [Epithemia clementina (nom. ined.)]